MSDTHPATPASKIDANTTPIVGIDLGTTNSLAAIIDGNDGQPRILADPETGTRLTKSVVSFDPNSDTWIVGQDAVGRGSAHPGLTVHSVKRLLGRSLAEIQAQGTTAGLPYALEEYDEGRMVAIRLGDRLVTPQELSARILSEVKRRAEAALSREIQRAVVTVPAYFDDAQRQATRDAGRLAGLDVVRIVNEPTAASLAYGLDAQHRATIAVYDLGGGTFDISILRVQGGIFKVLATAGDTALGGDDIDAAIAQLAADRLREARALDVGAHPGIRGALRLAAERAKIELTDRHEAELTLELPEAHGGPLAMPVTRAQFDSLVDPLIARTFAQCERALKDADIAREGIDEVVLVGGSTRVPRVREQVQEFFGRLPHTGLHPDEVVALGAAVQGHILVGGRRDMVLLDVVPLSLGLETYGGGMTKMITRNATVPCSHTDMFSTFADKQTAFDLHVLQGEREMAKDVRSLGHYTLSGIPPAPAGYPRLAVTFSVDQNGILTISAREERSGQSLEVTIQPSHGLSKAEVDQMVKASFEHALADMEARSLAELRNHCELVLRVTEKELPKVRAAGFYPEEKVVAIEQSLAQLRAELNAQPADPQRLQDAYDVTATVTAPLAERMVEWATKERLRGQAASSADLQELLKKGAPTSPEAPTEKEVPSARETPAAWLTFADTDRTVAFEHGQSILQAALAHGIEIDHACGGVCACSTCHVYVEEGFDHLREPEDAELDELDEAPALKLQSRLSCQAKLRDDIPEGVKITVRIPSWNRNAAREGGH